MITNNLKKKSLIFSKRIIFLDSNYFFILARNPLNILQIAWVVIVSGLNNRRWSSEAWAPAAGSVSNVGKPDLLRVSKFNNVEWRGWADRRDFKANSQQARSSGLRTMAGQGIGSRFERKLARVYWYATGLRFNRKKIKTPPDGSSYIRWLFAAFPFALPFIIFL